jgi:hypothetical protein
LRRGHRAGVAVAELIANASTVLPLFEPGDCAETCGCPDFPGRERANHDAAALGPVHTILSGQDHPLGARAVFLSV